MSDASLKRELAEMKAELAKVKASMRLLEKAHLATWNAIMPVLVPLWRPVRTFIALEDQKKRIRVLKKAGQAAAAVASAEVAAAEAALVNAQAAAAANAAWLAAAAAAGDSSRAATPEM